MPNVNGQQFPYDKQGLIDAAQAQQSQPPQSQPPQGQPPQGQPPQGQPPQGGRSDDGSAQLNELMDQASQLLYSDEIAKSLLVMNNKAKGKARGFADMVTHAVIQIDEKNGGKIPEDLILTFTEKVIDMLAEIVAQGTGKPLHEQILIKASSMAIGQLLDHYGVDEANLEGALKKFDGAELSKATNRIAGGFGGEAVVR